MKRHTATLIGALVIGTPAVASPVFLECVRDNPATVRGRTYQIIFDESRSTIARDGRKPVKARITNTLISWTEATQYNLGELWTIDRLSGAWHTELEGGTGVNGKCAAPPPRQF